MNELGGSTFILFLLPWWDENLFFVEPANTKALKAFVATKVKKGDFAQWSSFNKQNYCQTCSAPVVECSCFCFRTNNITWPNKLNAKNTSNINRTGHNLFYDWVCLAARCMGVFNSVWSCGEQGGGVNVKSSHVIMLCKLYWNVVD